LQLLAAMVLCYLQLKPVFPLIHPDAVLPQALERFFLILSIDLGETASFGLFQLLAAFVLCYHKLWNSLSQYFPLI
jgi:hypothetical protein